MLLGSLEPRPAPPNAAPAWLAIGYGYYPLVYTLKIACTLAAILWVSPAYKRFPFRLTWAAPLVGLAGIGVWVGLCGLHLESRFASAAGLGWLAELGRRSAYNPFQELAALPAWRLWTFLVVRSFGLVVVTAIIEEFFLRGLLMPLCVSADWQDVPFGTVSRGALLTAILYGVLTHPAELLAAAAWFALVTWLMTKTKSLWDCVVAHAVTNLLLGAYVLWSGHWELL
jgi:CAAX prenyl protease-like protein